MPIDQLLVIVLLIAGGVLVASLVLRALPHQRDQMVKPPQWLGRLSTRDAQAGEEEQATIIGEQIEDLVRKRLNAEPSLDGVSVDFGTAPDGGLQIWVDGDLYTEVDQIPDAKIRAAIAEAVAEFNR
jgi:hypothetical protein